MSLPLIQETKLVAIIRLPDLTHALDLAHALIAGGFRVLEFTLNSPGALDAIRTIRTSLPEVANGTVSVGAGTIRSIDDAHAAIDAGAQFIIMPTLKPKVIEVVKAAKLPVIPGALTPTEIEAAWDHGADIVKVFPSRALGPKYLQEIHGPMPEIKLMPTGGITRDMIGDFLLHGATAVGVGGNQLLNPEAIRARNWVKITEIAQTYVQEVIR
ncbi:MAG: bifunctional 4-hydroxy-2-oxoglutarate aldolase/2-dehydro-3-deoxy-phosphogluconate aldolase [Anaerolineae bacterium]|jgi:2-dehydro-3-deoxyphosphogluconate aldolase/(4S)-4-hydroxy-2-oxoglutarate aldolase|nr:bifunctional 4-hydroxy-2-oxoglutarate aldolase/2-dehydro-3-deoxy-phosphogluconate aldolase [Anaerolineae bacterium]